MTKFLHERLWNGLEVIGEVLPHAQSVAMGFFVRCGARNEPRELSGVSHFLEHMIFKGSETRQAMDVNRDFDALGASSNACTTEETTIFYASHLPEFLEQSVEIFADILRPVIREADFLAEKQVILEEIGMYEDSQPFCMDERIREEFFGDHPLAQSVLGTAESVGRMTSEQLRRYFAERYSPQNIVLCACGKVDFPELVRSAQKYCGKWVNCVSSEKPVKKRITTKMGTKIFERSQTSQQYILQAAYVPVRTLKERLMGRLAASMLGDDSGSQMYWELVDSGLAEHADLNFAEYTDAGLYQTSVGCEPEDAEEVLEKIKKIYKNAQDGGLTEKDLMYAKNRLVTATVLGGEKAWGRLFIGTEWLLRHEYRTVQEEVDAINSVSLASIHDFLKRYPLTDALIYRVGRILSKN